MKNYNDLKSAVQLACSHKDFLYLANLTEDLKTDMLITEKEHDELMSLLQKKIDA